jgi:hypothetical protein
VGGGAGSAALRWSEYEQKEPDYLLWGCFHWSFASASTPAGRLLQLIHGLGEGAQGAKS